MSAKIVQHPCHIGLLSDLPGEWVGDGGGVKRVIVGKIPSLQLVQCQHEPKRGILQLVGAYGREFKPKGLGMAVESADLGADIATHEGGREMLVGGKVSGCEVESQSEGGIGFVLRKDGFAIDTDAYKIVYFTPPPDGHDIVGGSESACGLVVLVVAVEATVAAILKAESEGADRLESVGISQRAEIGTRKDIDKAQGKLAGKGFAD